MGHDPTHDEEKNRSSIADIARTVEHEQIAEKAAAKTKEALMEGLKEVFGQGDNYSDGEYNILIRRIPLICQDVKQIHTDMTVMKDDIKGINNNTTWGVRIIIGAVILALLKMVLIP